MDIRGAIVSVVAQTTLVTGCGSKEAPSPASSATAAAPSPTSTSSGSAPASKAYTLGLQQVAKQAFDQYTGTGTRLGRHLELRGRSREHETGHLHLLLGPGR